MNPASTETEAPARPVRLMADSDNPGPSENNPPKRALEWEIIQRGDTSRNLVELYTITKPEEILAMLKEIVADIPKQGTRTDDAYQKEKERDKRRVADIQPILDQILTLQTPDGEHFSTPVPPQHILRQQEEPKPKEFKNPLVWKTCSGWKHNGYPGGYDGKETRPRRVQDYYWALTDLVGLFFAKLGPAPAGATKDNFFLPLTAVFARWTDCLMDANTLDISPAELEKFKPADLKKKERGGDKRGGAGASKGKTPETNIRGPTMYQCTWAVPLLGTGEYSEFSLGANIGGFHKGLLRKAFGNDLRKARWEILNQDRALQNLGIKVRVQDPHNRDKVSDVLVKWGWDEPAPAIWKFGNCAELFPMRQHFIDRDHEEKIRTWGFALKPEAIKVKGSLDYDEEWLLARKWNEDEKRDEHAFIEPPCKNCEFLIQLYGAKFEQFEPINLFRLGEKRKGKKPN